MPTGMNQFSALHVHKTTVLMVLNLYQRFDRVACVQD
jgi:hypothetical protein